MKFEGSMKTFRVNNRIAHTFRPASDANRDAERVKMVRELIASGSFTAADKGALEALNDETLKKVYARMKKNIAANCSCSNVPDMQPPSTLEAICENRRVTGFQRDQLMANARKRDYCDPSKHLRVSAADQDELKAMLPPSLGDLMRGATR